MSTGVFQPAKVVCVWQSLGGRNTRHPHVDLLAVRLPSCYTSPMRTKLLSLIIICVATIAHPRTALAGDGATIIMKSGVVVTINNGFSQLIAGMKSLKSSGVQNYPVEITIEGTSFFINLGEVALLCRDTCSSMTITTPKQGNSAKNP